VGALLGYWDVTPACAGGGPTRTAQVLQGLRGAGMGRYEADFIGAY